MRNGETPRPACTLRSRDHRAGWARSCRPCFSPALRLAGLKLRIAARAHRHHLHQIVDSQTVEVIDQTGPADVVDQDGSPTDRATLGPLAVVRAANWQLNYPGTEGRCFRNRTVSARVEGTPQRAHLCHRLSPTEIINCPTPSLTGQNFYSSI